MKLTEQQRRDYEFLKTADPDAMLRMTEDEWTALRKENDIPNYLREHIVHCIRERQNNLREDESPDFALDAWAMDCGR